MDPGLAGGGQVDFARCRGSRLGEQPGRLVLPQLTEAFGGIW